MAKIIKNLTGTEKVYSGHTLPANGTYILTSEIEPTIKNNTLLINDISKDPAEVSVYTDISAVQYTGAEGVKLLLDNIVVVQELPQMFAFSRKTTSDGKKLFRRKHGIKKTISANATDTIEITIPYTNCKIDEVEIVNCTGNDVVDLKVLDDSNGSYSGVPNYVLNQFGFDVCMTDLYYADSSNYEADLFAGMVVQVTFKNGDNESKNIGVNFVLHEVV